jgi:pantoate--beta-alanine ligase
MPDPIAIATTRDGLRAICATLRDGGHSLALVPTMGALHAGHLALVAEARRRADRVIVSVFVNPTQFAPHEDFDRYPRRLDADATMLAEAGADLVYAPDAASIYPPGDSTQVHVSGVSEPFEGSFRPHFFGGVASVVARLLIHAAPDVAVFGEKDFQQLAVIRRMTLDLGLPVAIVGAPTVREEDGLALSSRNAYLDPAQRAVAAILPATMLAMRDALRRGADAGEAEATARAALIAAGFGPVDYCSAARADTLEPVLTGAVAPGDFGNTRLLFAAWLGSTRLIDNCGLDG